VGRPRKEIDAELVRKLAKIGSTQKDIAEFFDCSQSVISERFRSDFQLGSAQSKISLRRLQWKAARAGSVPMLIHLGKVYLGQTDKLDVTTKGMARVVYVDRARNPRDEGTIIELPFKEGETGDSRDGDGAIFHVYDNGRNRPAAGTE